MKKSPLFSVIKNTIKRFPLSFLCIITFVLLSTTGLQIKNFKWIASFLFFGLFSYTLLKLFIENHQVSNKKQRFFTFILTLVLIYASYNITFLASLLLLCGIMLLFLVVPHIFNDMEEERSCHFNIELLINLFFTSIISIIFYSSISAILWGLEYLFQIKVHPIFYSTLYILTLELFAPLYALANIPQSSAIQEAIQEKKYPKSISFILSHLLSPLIIIYSIILHIYAIQIIISKEFQGYTGYLVIIFGLIGTFTHILSYPIKEKGNKILKIVHRYFYYALLTPLALLFTAIFVRIKHYGITEIRYILLTLAIWLLFISLYHIISKKAKSRNIILAISLILILSSFSFRGIIYISSITQTLRLQNLLEKNQILSNNIINQQNHSINFEDNKEITSIIQYLATNNQISNIQKWFPNPLKINITKEDNSFITSDKKEEAVQIMNALGLPYIHLWEKEKQQNNKTDNEFHLYKSNTLKEKTSPSIKKDSTILLSKITNFDYYTKIHYASFQTQWSQILKYPTKGDGDSKNQTTLKLHTQKNGTLTFEYPNKNIVITFDLLDIVKNLIKQGFQKSDISELTQDPFKIIKTKDGLNISIDIFCIKGTSKDKDNPIISYADFDIAIKYP